MRQQLITVKLLAIVAVRLGRSEWTVLHVRYMYSTCIAITLFVVAVLFYSSNPQHGWILAFTEERGQNTKGVII